MIKTDEQLAYKIEYLKHNHYMPNIDGESLSVQNVIRSFYFCSKTVTPKGNKPHDDDFWFKLTFTNYQVTDEFVHEVNREYKRFQILNIGKGEY